MFAGHIKMPGGPHVARGPDVAQACFQAQNFKIDDKECVFQSLILLSSNTFYIKSIKKQTLKKQKKIYVTFCQPLTPQSVKFYLICPLKWFNNLTTSQRMEMFTMEFVFTGVFSGLTDAPVSQAYSEGRDRDFPSNFVTRCLTT